MQLFLVRHGEYRREDPQPLSNKGIADIQKVAQFFKDAKVEIGFFYHSTKMRAKQTAEILRDVLNPKLKLCEKNYLSPNDCTDNIVYDISGFHKNVMIVGHLPFISKLTSRLVTGDEEDDLVTFQPGTTVVLEKDTHQNWHVLSLINPALLVSGGNWKFPPQ